MIRLAKDLAAQIGAAIRAAQSAGALPAAELPEIRVTPAKNPEHGDYATAVAMQLAKSMSMKPDAIAAVIAEQFPSVDYIGGIERLGGFINFRLSPSWLQAQIGAILAEGAAYGNSDACLGKRAQVECVSANPTGPLSVGRVRGGVIGDALARVLNATGYSVELEYYFNNAGNQMRKLGESLRARYLTELDGLETPLPPDAYQGEYLVEIARQLKSEHGDSYRDRDWEAFKDYAEARVFDMIKAALKRIRIEHQTFFNENSLYTTNAVWEVLDRLRATGYVYEALQAERDEESGARPAEEDEDATTGGKPAIWIRMRALREVEVDKALVKSSGEPTYRLPDVAYHLNKLDRGFDLAVNILGADHIEEYKDVAAMVAALGYDASRIRVVLHQFVTVLKGGKEERMSTRAGNFITLEDLLDQVSPDAVRYFILARSANSTIAFDIDLAVKQSNENPVFYIQNGHVRCASMIRTAAERGIDWSDADLSLLTDPRELALIRKLLELPELIDLIASELEPHRLAFWAHEELARTFHPIYDEVRALHSDVPEPLAKARLKLYAAVQVVFARTLSLMGMSAPEQM